MSNTFQDTSKTAAASYLGNPHVKRDGVVEEMTQDQVKEYSKCMNDPAYFAIKYLKVIHLDKGLVSFDLYPYQSKMFDHFNDNRFNIVLACRQSGKCCHPDTLINVCFLGGHSENVKIKTLFEIFTSINNYRLKYYSDESYVFRKQIHKDISFDNREAEEVFNRWWGSSSYNSKKLWWNRLFRKPSKVDFEGTLYLSPVIDKNVLGGVCGEVFNVESIPHDVSYERRYTTEKFENVSIFEGRMAFNSIREYEGKEQPILWEEAQSSSEGVSWEKTRSNSKRQNIQFFKGTMEGFGISSENEISIYGRDERKNVEIPQKQTSFGAAQAIYKVCYEYSNDERTYVENSFRQNTFRGTQTENIGINVCEGNDQRTFFENIGILERQSEVERTQEEVIRIGEETSQENFGMSSLSENWERPSDVSISFQQLQETKKFVESYEGFGFTVESDTGFEELYQVHKTIKFDQYVLKTSDGFELICADNHIVFDEFYNETFVKDIKAGTKIQTENGLSKVSSVVCKGNPIHMYDIGVNHDNHRFFSSGILSHNSISSCAYLLWYSLFHSEKTIAILANKGATAREMLSRITLMLENIPFWLQPGCKALNKGSVEFSNNSRIIAAATSGSSIRGLSVNLLYLDEFAFVDNDVEFFTSTYPVISSGKSSKVIITSTANGIGNMFYKIWEGAQQKINEFSSFRVDWWDVPGRDEEWKRQTISNTSEIQFAQEFENAFHGGHDTLINSNTLLGLKAHTPLFTHNSVRVYEKPKESNYYMMFVDVAHGRGQDYSTFNIIDISKQPFKQVACYQDNNISPLLFPDIIYKYAKTYNEAYVIIESNDQGTVVGNGLYHELEYENVYLESSIKSDIGIRMTKKVKRIGCSNAKDLIEANKLEIVDPGTINELSTFKARGTSYEASDGCHDDLVMNLVMLGYFTTLPFFRDLTDINIRQMIHEQNIKMIEDDVLPFGIVNDGHSNFDPRYQIEEEIPWGKI